MTTTDPLEGIDLDELERYGKGFCSNVEISLSVFDALLRAARQAEELRKELDARVLSEAEQDYAALKRAEDAERRLSALEEENASLKSLKAAAWSEPAIGDLSSWIGPGKRHATVEDMARDAMRWHDEAQAEKLANNQDLDCTDAAHPAWWRGERHATESVAQRVLLWLDGGDGGGVIGSERLEAARRKILEVREENARLKNDVRALAEAATSARSNIHTPFIRGAIDAALVRPGVRAVMEEPSPKRES